MPVRRQVVLSSFSPASRIMADKAPYHVDSSYLDQREAQHQHEVQQLLDQDRLCWFRVALAGIALALAGAVVGCSAHFSQVYGQTSIATQWYLPLWPSQMSNGPTVVLIASGSIVASSHLLVLLATFTPLVRPAHPPGSPTDRCQPSRVTVANHLALASAVIGFVLAVVSVAYSALLDNSDTTFTIRSWTCQWGDLVQTANVADFAQLCRESVRTPAHRPHVRS